MGWCKKGTIVQRRCAISGRSVIRPLWLFQSLAAGRGAAVGWFWGTVAKLAIGAVIVVMLAIAAFV